MSSSTFTYTFVYTDPGPWRFYRGSDEEPADAGSSGVIVYGYDGLTMHPIAPPSPDYVPDPKHPPSPDYMPSPKHPPLPVYVPELEYPEYLVPSGDEAPIEDQPPPADASPTALSLGYMADSDSEEYPEEDPEEDHANYPADGGDGDDEPSDDDDDDDDDDADDEDEEASEDEEEEEHLAPSDSSAIPVVDPVPSVGDTPRSPQIIVPPSQTQLRRARKRIPSPPLPVSSPLLPLLSPLTTNPIDAKVPLGYRAARIRIRATSPPLLLLSTSYRTDIPEAEMPPRKRVSFTTLALGFVVGESSAAGAARQPRPTLEADLMQDTDEFYVRFEDAQDDRAFLRA
ncbi:hypothetical protein Tco_0190661 [Tanacetum coccineum]